jgi:hypothetical protein
MLEMKPAGWHGVRKRIFFMDLPPEGEGGAPAPEGGCLNKHGVNSEPPYVLRHPPSALRAPSPSGGRHHILTRRGC